MNPMSWERRLRITAAIAALMAALALAFSGGVTWSAHHPGIYCAAEDSCAYSYHNHVGTVVPVTP